MPKRRESFRKVPLPFFFISRGMCERAAIVLDAHGSRLPTLVCSNNRSEISPVLRVLSRAGGCDPAAPESLQPLGPGSAEIKLCTQISRKGGQGPNGGWGTGQ